MNNRSAQFAHLESRRWWWPSAVAGVAASAAIAAIAVVPIAGYAMPTEGTRYEAPGTFFPAPPDTSGGAGTETVRPCFMVRPRWNVALDWPQPTCPRTPPTTGSRRHRGPAGVPDPPQRPPGRVRRHRRTLEPCRAEARWSACDERLAQRACRCLSNHRSGQAVAGNLTPVLAWQRYPNGFLARYCWWWSSA